jgi:signal transduction histidine kinase
MSHELRTPLNAVLGFAQLLEMSELDERQRGHLEHILSAGRNLLELIDDLLDISRLEAGELRLSLEPLRVGPVVVDAVELVSLTAGERGIEVAVEPNSKDDPSGRDPDVIADGQRLRQALVRVLSAAVAFTRDNGHVRVSVSPAGGARVRIAVRGDGPGIPADVGDQLFRPLQGPSAGPSAPGGTGGRGLAVAGALLEAMGAGIRASTRPGTGTEFTIELRACVPQAAARCGTGAS